MRIGIPKEIKAGENRVAMTPQGVEALRRAGASVDVQAGAGEQSGFPDGEYLEAGGRVVPSAAMAWDADLVVKVKEPVPGEFPFLSEKTVLFTYLHLAAMPALTDALLERRVTGIAYETVSAEGRLPLLKPMSEVAGILSVQAGARALEKSCGGRGVLLSGAGGVPPSRVVVIGAGTAGKSAARIAAGVGADVTILDVGGTVETSRPTTHASPYFIEEGVVHYCVANMPAAVPRTSTAALVSATLPYVLALVREGAIGALRKDPALRAGLNTFRGKVTCEGVAKATGKEYTPPETLLYDRQT
ncbi:MAG: alanine dehydrogenase [Deltaproteobacteria bacterium]|nr:alanine dehydrogenase [Deltaproteobacteria bacterium]